MRRIDIYLPAGADYDGINVVARPDERYNPTESARKILDLLDEFPKEVMDIVIGHPRFSMGRNLASRVAAASKR